MLARLASMTSLRPIRAGLVAFVLLLGAGASVPALGSEGAAAPPAGAEGQASGWFDWPPPAWARLFASGLSYGELQGLRIELDLTLVKGVVALCALGVFGWGAWLGRTGRGGRWRRTRLCALGLLALVSFCTYYNFFTWRRSTGHVHDVFHYYLNSKYFPELGYFDLYACAFLAVAEREGKLDARDLRIRDLRSDELRPPLELVPRTTRCGGAFSLPRWQQFKADVGWFHERLGEAGFWYVLQDFGYNPSPIWTLVGGSLASLAPANDVSMRRLASIDLVLVLIAFAAIGWAFGFETLCLAVLTWSTNPMPSYMWTGDAFLRFAWFVSAMLGLCLLRKGWSGTAGALFAFSSLLRLFPVFFTLGYGLQHAWRWLRTRRLDAGFRRFVLGAAVASVLLLVAAGVRSGRGIDAYLDFGRNIGRWSQLTANNSFGLRPLLSYERPDPERPPPAPGSTLRLQREREAVFASRLPLFLALCALFAVLFWRAAQRVADWEAAAIGVVPICVLLQPPNYYTSCIVAVALLAGARPRVGVALLLLLVGLNLSRLCLFSMRHRPELAASAALAMLFFAYLLWELGRRPAPATPHSTA
jgi:hypothetical protein